MLSLFKSVIAMPSPIDCQTTLSVSPHQRAEPKTALFVKSLVCISSQRQEKLVTKKTIPEKFIASLRHRE